jgi:hypothetical protein
MRLLFQRDRGWPPEDLLAFLLLLAQKSTALMSP